jgi:thiol:disulfide interchange protein DsbD
MDEAMRFRLPFLLILLGVLLTESPLHGEPHTRVKAYANVTSIQPGSEFTLGVLMVMDEGWHTYWKNPGEAGLPTTIRWTLPKGLSAGEMQWPLPHKYIEGGEVLTYGYAGENMLLIQMRTDAALPVGSTVRIKADLDWLECEHVCIPGSGSISISLPVQEGQPQKSHQELFDRYSSAVPKELEASKKLSLSSRTSERNVILSVTSMTQLVPDEYGPADFYPESLEGIEFGRTKISSIIDGASIALPLSAYEPVQGERTLRGVLVYHPKEDVRTGSYVEIPLSAEFCSSLFQEEEKKGTGSILDREFTSIIDAQQSQPLYLYFIFAFIGGILLNIMPCVLPVIALKVFGLVSLGGDQPGRVRKLGWVFSLGILVSFLSLALIVILLQAAGEQVGWGFQFQEPAFVIAMCTIVFAFGLSLFGVYEIQLPGSAVTGMSELLTKQSTSGKSLSSSFAEGVFATILATPCTAPFLGTALGFAFSQPAPIILLLFASVALGMALPYLVLTSRPAWTKFLPKPGVWMVKAKQLMGFLMMATLLWLLYVLGKQLGMEAVVWTGAFLLVVGLACWLIGSFATLSSSRKQHAFTWLGVALLLFVGYQTFLTTVFDAQTVLASTTDGTQPEIEGSIHWYPFSLQSLDEQLRSNKPVFVDFTAEWCLTCKVNEKAVIGDDDVINKFKSLDVIAVRADWTNRNPDITQLLAKFGRSGVPLYVIFPAGKPGEPIVLPEVITTGIVLDALDRATSAITTETR